MSLQISLCFLVALCSVTVCSALQGAFYQTGKAVTFGFAASFSISRQLLEGSQEYSIPCTRHLIEGRRRILQNPPAEDGPGVSLLVDPTIKASCPPPESLEQCFVSDTCTNILARILEACSYRPLCEAGIQQVFQTCAVPGVCPDLLKSDLQQCEEVGAQVAVALICAGTPYIFTGTEFLFAEVPDGVSIDLLPDGVTLDEFRTTGPGPSPPTRETSGRK